ncbi:aldo/keto reductase [Candidatus Pantoea deserta]|uniref:Aldo/keto reductase n=1 Tax=Candidatus Pantoea deserta TaxID=1869313 RepID=A0A3N4NQP1_9GAMM|nr:aldo/keto reductase [Pantoea deserta]RPD96798.1 aldo/keto reductase [Pantoea deserta]
MNYLKLNSGKRMPQLGFGVYQINDAGECEDAVLAAIDAGYRLIDTAAAYQNEEAVGRAIRRSGVPREELFITTKVWVQDMGYSHTLRAIDRSLERLELDYLDLYLIHQPYSDVFGSWRAMEEKYDSQILRSIGVSNFSPDRLTDLTVFSRVAPAVNQVEINPFYQQHENVAFMQENGIQPQSWASFAEGRNNLFQLPSLLNLGEKYGKSVAQIVLRWLIQRNVVVIPKSVNPARMAQNIDVFDFELTASEVGLIKGMDTGVSCFHSHTDPERIRNIAGVRFDI